jgi:hypothetical protein
MYNNSVHVQQQRVDLPAVSGALPIELPTTLRHQYYFSERLLQLASTSTALELALQ